MTMASLNKATLESDEEDDLESLRLAALKSLKPKSASEIQNKQGNGQCKPLFNNKLSSFGAAQTTRHHNRGFRNGGRSGRNLGNKGNNSRIRTNPNLISIPTIDPDVKETKETVIDIPKLILPQDRYHKPLIEENTSKEGSGNKFDRYDDNSDDSESDSEVVTRRERKTSVDLLVDELENEINLLESKEEAVKEEEEEVVEETPTQSDTLIISETDPDLVVDEPVEEPKIEEPPIKKSRSRSPSPYSQKHKSKTKSRSRSPYVAKYKSRSPRSRSPPRKRRYSLSPLAINTEVLNTITMAPLSPRSAAFVLENRQILARRQMSPRRSLSRESSCRRSLTPKPRRRSPVRRSLSPRTKKKRSPSLSKKRATSPYVDRKPEKRKRTSRSISLSLSPSPDRNYKNRKEKRRESPEKPKEDPILEARRRKFESPVQINNGIIKLKTTKPEEEPKIEEKENSDVEEEVIDLNPTLDDLWSDEESDDENEGRFKSKPSTKPNLPVPSFRKLTERPIPSLLPEDNDHRDRRYKRQRRRRSRTPLKTTNKDLKKEPEKPKKPKLEEEKKLSKLEKKTDDILKPIQVDKNVKRKVKIDTSESTNENKETPVESKDTATKKEDDAGDLRAELSRRRAQRMIKAGNLAGSVSGRLLKTALQEVVPKKSPVKQDKDAKGNGSTSAADRRVLIVKRLASSPEPANKVGSKEGKLPIHMRLGSNPESEDAARSERRKRRPSRRKKPVQV